MFLYSAKTSSRATLSRPGSSKTGLTTWQYQTIVTVNDSRSGSTFPAKGSKRPSSKYAALGKQIVCIIMAWRYASRRLACGAGAATTSLIPRRSRGTDMYSIFSIGSGIPIPRRILPTRFLILTPICKISYRSWRKSSCHTIRLNL